MAFDPNKYLASKQVDSTFDPDKYLSTKEQPSQLESFGRGAAQTLSFGFADEITGLGEAAMDWLKNDPQGFMDNYRKHRDESRQNYKEAEEANPGTYTTGQIAGAVAPAILSLGGSTAATVGNLAAQGAAQGLGSSEADLTEGDIGQAAKDTAIGGTVGAATGLAGKALSKIPVGKIFNKGADILEDGAEKLAINATGATGAQSAKFADNAGRELLDRGWVQFGDDAEKIAERVRSARLQAGESIGNALEELDKRGVTTSIDNVVAALESKADELSQTPGNEGIVRQLRKEIENLYERGQSNIKLSEGEIAKRNYQGQVNYFSPEAEKKGATHVADAFRKEVEETATQADPAIAKAFKEDKATYGLAAPIEEAAQKRANTLNQSPFGGLGDFVAGGVGSIGGIPGAAASMAARRIVAPRISSSGAVIADNLADVVRMAPQKLGRYARPLQNAAARGSNSLAATHYVLEQTDPEYRQIINQDMDHTDEEE